jgi:hypothetical protein
MVGVLLEVGVNACGWGKECFGVDMIEFPGVIREV